MSRISNGSPNFSVLDYSKQASFQTEINANFESLFGIAVASERARQHNGIQKVLEGANIKLGSVVSDIWVSPLVT